MSSSNYFRSWIDRPHLDPNTRLVTEEYQRGITEFMGLVHRQPEAKTEKNDGEPVDDLALMKRTYTNQKTGHIDDGLVREVVTLVQTQVQDEVSQLQTEDDDSTASTNLSRFRINEIVESLKDKDDRISLLETQMVAQQAGYEAQKRLNQQMMEMMQRMYPNEVFPNVQDP
ncbi:hypothetical protein F2Q69_00050376 [Brassica cretica]|uniref:Uncharacterized protein n=1 Tax=Brassica cretica TaxID=69181 RepID=A0A8S9PTE1_BRACR|nr:hypothetical protein F2Q69_00050376 [Brassica cretica]